MLHDRRRSIRLRTYDYRKPGAFLVTICTRNREPLFARRLLDRVSLTRFGSIAHDAWHRIPTHFPHVQLDEFIVMSDHIHGILFIASTPERHTRATHASPLRVGSMSQRARGPTSGGLGAIVGSYKSSVTRAINRQRGTLGAPVWQRNYHERIIRSPNMLRELRWYVRTNPLRSNPGNLIPPVGATHASPIPIIGPTPRWIVTPS